MNTIGSYCMAAVENKFAYLIGEESGNNWRYDLENTTWLKLKTQQELGCTASCFLGGFVYSFGPKSVFKIKVVDDPVQQAGEEWLQVIIIPDKYY